MIIKKVLFNFSFDETHLRAIALVSKIYQPLATSVFNLQNRIFETRSSIVFEDGSQNIVKLLKVRHLAEIPKLLFGKNRAILETNSNLIMASLGLQVPSIICRGLFIRPFEKKYFLSFYQMSPVPKQYVDGVDIFPTISTDSRNAFIQRFVRDLKILKENGYVYSDLSLRNLMIDIKGNYFWIDTQLKKYLTKNKFREQYNRALKRFINNQGAFLLPEHKQQLENILFK